MINVLAVLVRSLKSAMGKICKIVLIVLILLVVFAVIYFFKKEDSFSVCFRESCFDMEVALSPDEIQKGLMSRKELDYDKGMIFIFDDISIHPFWMKNTLIPLDMVWLNEEKEAVFISENNQPCSEDQCLVVTPDKDSKYVLEFLAGIVDNIDLKIGDEVDF